MSWMEQLVQTYDENRCFVGKDDVLGQKAMLVPIGHTIVNAHISITLNGNGELISAETVPKEEAETVIPCTPESSASRTSTHEAPHPLHDSLKYVARDYQKYVEHKKPIKSDNSKETPFELYIKLLHSWIISKYTHSKIEAVYQYVVNHDLIQDLVKYKILFKDNHNQISNRWNGTNKPQNNVLKAVIRFRVDMNDGSPVDLWKDREVQKCYVQFFTDTFLAGRGICFATGKEESIVEGKYAKLYIRYSGDGAKLISSNDDKEWTYRGRFKDDKECVTIGVGAYFKAMNALRWLIRNQGYKNIVPSKREKTKVFLAWGRCGVVPPEPITDTNRIVRRGQNREKSSIPRTMQAWAAELHKAMDGYRHEFKKAESAQVNLIVLDAATKGRMSICYYSEMTANDFVNRVEEWHKSGFWCQHYDANKGKEKEECWRQFFGVPHPKRIISACYGDKAGDSQVKMALERIFQCIVNGKPVPRDMIRAAVGRVVKRSVIASGKEYLEWKYNLLEPACSLLCNQIYFDHQSKEKEVYLLALDLENRNRSYLYGRLLSIADNMERATYSKDERYNRLTNAMKYMERFSQRPCSTWGILQKKLIPYERKTESLPYKPFGFHDVNASIKKGVSNYRTVIDEIVALFNDDDFISDAPLDSYFLLGFYCQNYDIEQWIQAKKATKKQMSIKDEEEGDNHDSIATEN